MNKPFFSILIPVYNVEKYLSTCLESVLRQSYKDYEIILVDDGSKDSSGKICDDYVARYPGKIHVHHKPNQGLISARRIGLKLANGHFICFLDSDDCWNNNTLSRIYETIETSNPDIVLYGWSKIDENGVAIGKPEPGVFNQSGPIEKIEFFERMLSGVFINPLWAKCCRYELFDIDVDYSDYYKIQNGEDFIQSLPVLYNANTIYYLNEPLYQYRVNMASITHVYKKGQYRTLSIVRPLLYKYIVKMGLDTDQNVKTFFNTYLTFLWKDVEAMFSGISSVKERNAALDEVRSYEFVKKGREFLDICNLPKQAHLGLSVFYKSNNKVMNTYMGIYLPVIKALRGAKAALRKLLK